MKLLWFSIGLWVGGLLVFTAMIWALSKAEPQKPEVIYVSEKDKMMICLGKREREAMEYDHKNRVE